MQVWVTRVQPQADLWVQDLQRHGWAARALPLIDITPLADAGPLQAAWQALGQWQAVMFVSHHAVHAFFAQTSPLSPVNKALDAIKTRAWCTGPGTRAALLACGWPAARVDAPGAQASSLDSEALWAQVSAQAHPGVRVLIVRGTQDDAEADAAGAGVGRDWLAQALRQAGAQVDFLAAYARGLPRWSAAQQASAAQAVGREHLWLFSSVQAVQHLAQLLPDQRWAGTPAVATHARIAQAAQDLGFTPVRLARPSLSEVMASIESLA